jgi:hypothetical protein
LDDKLVYEQHARRWALECEHVIRSWQRFETFTLSLLVLDWSTRRRSSRGGLYKEGPGINIAMSIACMPRTTPYRVYEYKSFDADPVIGGFYGVDPHLPVAWHVCHEMAHAAQYYGHYSLGIESDRAHGKQFKSLYSKLRVATINKLIPLNQLQMKEEYYAMLMGIVTGKIKN